MVFTRSVQFSEQSRKTKKVAKNFNQDRFSIVMHYSSGELAIDIL